VVQQSRQFSSWRRARQWSSRRAGLLRAIGRRDRVGRLDAGTLGDAVGRRCSGRSDRSTYRPRSRPTTGGWTRPPSGSKHLTGRLHGAQGIIPLPVWIALNSIFGVIFAWHQPGIHAGAERLGRVA
jgi:hypothetical protein